MAAFFDNSFRYMILSSDKWRFFLHSDEYLVSVKQTIWPSQTSFQQQGPHYIQGLFKDIQGPWSCIFKEQFSMEVYSMDSITAIFNIYFCDYGTVLVDKNKTYQLLATLCSRQNTCLMKLLISCSLTWWIQGLSSTCPIFKYFQGLAFRGKKFKYFQGLSRMHGNPAANTATITQNVYVFKCYHINASVELKWSNMCKFSTCGYIRFQQT